jgi:EAL domain-containing protein (putative c-di-GMP-specific phosphodiesterase class I)
MSGAGGSDAIVRSTIALAHSLGIGVIAEGIEHLGQLRRLQILGCELGQGLLFSGPVPSSEVEALLAGWPSGRAAAAPVPERGPAGSGAQRSAELSQA